MNKRTVIPPVDVEVSVVDTPYLKQIIRQELRFVVKQELPALMREAVKPDFLRTEQAAKELQVSKGTLLNWRKSGAISFVQRGKTILYPRESIEGFKRDHLIEGEY